MTKIVIKKHLSRVEFAFERRWFRYNCTMTEITYGQEANAVEREYKRLPMKRLLLVILQECRGLDLESINVESEKEKDVKKWEKRLSV